MSDNDKDSECAACQKTESQLGKPLKSCAKCKVTKYCGRECQTGHWKKHKKDCATNAAATATNASTAPSDRGSSTSASCKNLKGSNEGPFHKLHDKTWLHGRPEEDVFKLFLDAYRLRLNDDYNMSGDVDVDFLEGDQLRPFRKFLIKAEKRNNLLPDWWSKEKAAYCIKFGSGSSSHSWSTMAEKAEIMEYYGNPTMPMQLRMFAEQVYGSGPGGQSGAAMMHMMMQQEGGDGGMQHASLLDASRARFG